MPAQETAKDYIPLARPALIYTPFAKVEKEYPLIQRVSFNTILSAGEQG
jgi:hypothetical protein